MLTYESIKKNDAIRTYITRADESLAALGFTEHSFAHVCHVAEMAGYILTTLGYDARTVELAKIAGYLHDIGNLVNRSEHSQSGAVMAWTLLHDMGCDPAELATIVTAIGNHDEGTGVPVNAVAAALILADKADVRRSRVRNTDETTFDIHDRVNYSVKHSELKINQDKTLVKLKLTVDTRYGSVMDYFEIFLGRMILCRKAAEKLGLQFKLIINEQQLI
ncbi:MAG: HD domain-containing protein [Ruminococcaceae bacterium]|nr:HD domain-containing protein [Oscillospiraceae bacterium]